MVLQAAKNVEFVIFLSWLLTKSDYFVLFYNTKLF